MNEKVKTEGGGEWRKGEHEKNYQVNIGKSFRREGTGVGLGGNGGTGP